MVEGCLFEISSEYSAVSGQVLLKMGSTIMSTMLWGPKYQVRIRKYMFLLPFSLFDP